MFAKLFKKSTGFVSPTEGMIKELEAVNDEVFSSKAMGEGFAIEPKSSKIYSPVDGTVAMVFRTNHAIGLRTEDGKEILIHVGIDTVNLEGKGFTSHVSENQKVKQGDLLLTVDFNSIKDLVPSIDVIVIFTSGQKCEVNHPNQVVNELEKDIVNIK